MPEDQDTEVTTNDQQAPVEVEETDPLIEAMRDAWQQSADEDAQEIEDEQDDSSPLDEPVTGDEPPVDEADADAPSGDLEPIADVAPYQYLPDLPSDLFTAEEFHEIVDAQESLNPQRIAAMNIQIALRAAEYSNRAAQVTQTHLAGVPQAFMNVHGANVMRFLNSLPPDRRGTAQAIEEAQNVAVYHRGKEIGMAKAFAEASQLLSGQSQVTVPVVEEPVKPPVNRTPMPADKRFPGGNSNTQSDARRTVNLSRDERNVRGVLSALGLDK